MNLGERIRAIYPDLTDTDFHPIGGTILLQNDGDERGDYVARWEHPHPQPTDEQLAAAGG